MLGLFDIYFLVQFTGFDFLTKLTSLSVLLLGKVYLKLAITKLDKIIVVLQGLNWSRLEPILPFAHNHFPCFRSIVHRKTTKAPQIQTIMKLEISLASLAFSFINLFIQSIIYQVKSAFPASMRGCPNVFSTLPLAYFFFSRGLKYVDIFNLDLA